MQDENVITNETDLKGQVAVNEAVETKPRKRKGFAYVRSSRGKDSPLIPVYPMNLSRPSVIVVWEKEVVFPENEGESLISDDLSIIIRSIRTQTPLAFKTLKTFDSMMSALGFKGYYRTALEGLDGVGSSCRIDGVGTLYLVPIFMSGRSTKGKGMAPIEKVKRTFEAREEKMKKAMDAMIAD